MSPFALKRVPAVLAAASGALATSAALAIEPANLQTGPFYVTPTLDTDLGYTDNLYRSSGDKVSTWKSLVTPRIQAWLENGLNTYSLTYEGDDYRYFSSHDDDFYDQTVNLDIHQEFNARNRFNAFAEYYDGHEERGTGVAELAASLLDGPVELKRKTLGGDYIFGAVTTRGRLQLNAKTEDIVYQNFRQRTQYRDYDKGSFGGTFFWAISPRTDILADLRYEDVAYAKVDPGVASGTRDAEQWSYFLGAEWDATAKISGSIRLGIYDREYDSALREDDDGFSWEVDVTYSPRTYSSLNLESRRYTQETNGLGDAVDTNETSLTWEHDWASRSRTTVGAYVGTDDYTGSEREDDRWGVDLSYTYALRRWIDLGIGYRYEDRESDITIFDYNRNEYYLKAEFSL